MLYKPNFCCNCGEKIERIEWNLLTSRRFCPACAVEHQRYDHVPKAVVAVGSLALMFGIGSLWAGSAPVTDGPKASPVGIRSAVPAAEVPRTTIAGPIQDTPPPQAPAAAPNSEPEQSAKSAAMAYYCGALTKKGTPCSRKVKTKGVRCFQHEGRTEASQGQ